MSSSKLLEQAIVDAQALRDSAYKSAQATLLEKFAPQVKEAVEKLLEQGPEEDPAAGADPTADPAAAAPPTDFGGAPPDESNKGYVAGTAKDIPLAATDGEKLCPCPDEDGEVTLNIDLADLADQLKIGKEAEEEEDINMQPMLGGMQNPPPAAGGAAPMMESLELEEGEGEFELEEDLDENLTEVDLDEALSEMGPHGSDYEGTDDPKELKADLNKDGKLSGYEKARGKAIAKAMQKTNESKEVEQTKQLIKASSALLKEVENKDAKINKLLEENKKFSSTIEEMSEAFKKLEQVNTLNARLFYENQVLKSASLNERQKTHIVEAISKADSVSEAKAMYETLINSVGGSAEKERSPKSLNEAINKKSSFRLPHKQAEQPNDPGKDRWLKLAGIK
jgi:hypothetical protein